MTQFLRDQASDSEEVVTPLMLDGTYLSRNFICIEGNSQIGDRMQITDQKFWSRELWSSSNNKKSLCHLVSKKSTQLFSFLRLISCNTFNLLSWWSLITWKKWLHMKGSLALGVNRQALENYCLAWFHVRRNRLTVRSFWDFLRQLSSSGSTLQVKSSHLKDPAGEIRDIKQHLLVVTVKA